MSEPSERRPTGGGSSGVKAGGGRLLGEEMEASVARGALEPRKSLAFSFFAAMQRIWGNLSGPCSGSAEP